MNAPHTTLIALAIYGCAVILLLALLIVRKIYNHTLDYWEEEKMLIPISVSMAGAITLAYIWLGR